MITSFIVKDCCLIDETVVSVYMFGIPYNKEHIAKVADRYDIPEVEYSISNGDDVPIPLHLLLECS